MLTYRDYRLPFIIVTTLFALWGVANNMTDILLATFKKVMSMSDFQTSWIQIAFYGAYFCLAFPAALFMQRFSYKAGILLGLGLYALGAALCYPASTTMVYWHFLVAFYVLAGGCSILETAANPYILHMGPAETATRRLNLAQAFNPLGSLTGILLGKYVILSNLHSADAAARNTLSSTELLQIQTQELHSVALAYGIIAAISIALWVVIFFNSFPYAKAASEETFKLSQTLKRLLKQRQWTAGVITQFFYVGAQIGIWSFTIRYVMQALDIGEAQASDYYFYSLVLFSLSRFLCTGLMTFISAEKLLTFLSLLAALCTGLVMSRSDIYGVYALVLTSGCMSLMFPTIYSIALRDTGEDTKIAASGLVMAILGGAVLTAVQGLVSDTFSINMSFAIPLSSFLIIGVFALTHTRKRPSD